MQPEEWQALGLYDPAADDAADRLSVLNTLLEHGITLDEIRASTGGTRDLARLLRDGLLWDDRGRITLRELAERSGMSLELARRVRLVFGLRDPGDEPLCRTAEVELMRAFAAGAAFFGEEPVLEFTRVIGTAIHTIGDASMSMFVSQIGVPMQDAGATSAQYAKRVFDASQSFLQVPRIVDVLIRMHFEQSVDDMVPVGELATTMVPAAIGFVDLVDSTRLTQRTEVAVLHRSLAAFEQYAVIRATELGGRIVKLIGDEVMFAARTLENGVRIATDLVGFATEDPNLAGARGAVAYGVVTPRDGDYFGTVVNLAARLTGLGEVGDVLVDAATADELADGATAPLGEFELKGFDEPVAVLRVISR